MSDILGASRTSTSFPDVQISCVEGQAAAKFSGLGAMLHNPRSLKNFVESLSQQPVPKVLADSVLLRRKVLAAINKIWRCPLASNVPATVPIASTIIEAETKSVKNNFELEFQIMKLMDFISRNVIRIELPMIDCTEIVDSWLAENRTVGKLSRKDHTYLGAWHRDLIPRIIDQVIFYPRSANHQLFVYSGYDIYLHNVIFGNAHKEMNDLMSGEDKFELCYDPYRVDGSALGLSSYVGVDSYVNFTKEWNTPQTQAGMTYTARSQVNGSDSLVDYFQLDDTMDSHEFTNAYRKNVWYEAPIAQNYAPRHSIHSRRLVHYPKSIDIPLDILPFSYSLASSLPVAALAAECGYIKVHIHQDWLRRAFYLTKASDIPVSHPIPNHVHLQEGSMFPLPEPTGTNKLTTLPANSKEIGWVDPMSLGRYGDPDFMNNHILGSDASEIDSETADKVLNTNNTFSTHGNVVGRSDYEHRADALIPTGLDLASDNPTSVTNTFGRQMADGTGSTLKRQNYFSTSVSRSTTAMSSATQRSAILEDALNPIIYPIDQVDSDFYTKMVSQIRVRLFQIGFQTMDCISEMLTNFPNIYVTTEWSDDKHDVNENLTKLEIDNDRYHMADIFWVIPTDSNGIESMRVFPCHMINHEMPLINKMTIRTEQSQGTTIYDWDMLNLIQTSFMNLNPLLYNIGMFSFTPVLECNQYPLSYYDPNICGKLIVELARDTTSVGVLTGANQYTVNIRSGYILIVTLGVNALVLGNMGFYRLSF